MQGTRHLRAVHPPMADRAHLQNLEKCFEIAQGAPYERYQVRMHHIGQAIMGDAQLVDIESDKKLCQYRC